MKDLGFKLMTTGVLMMAVALTLGVTELLGAAGVGGFFSLGVGGAGALVLVVGWLLDARQPPD